MGVVVYGLRIFALSRCACRDGRKGGVRKGLLGSAFSVFSGFQDLLAVFLALKFRGLRQRPRD